MLIKSVFLRVIAAVIAGVMMLFVGADVKTEYDVKYPDECKLNFTVISDSHIEGNNLNRYKVFAKSLQDVKNNKRGNDAVVFLGDNTMNGQHIENLLFHGTAAEILKNETVLPVMGNHDIGNGNGDYEKLQNRWYDYTNAFFGKKLDHPYYYDVIDGCYFIILGMEKQQVHEMYISDEQFAWLEDVLASAGQSGKPAFVFSHYPSDYATDDNGNSTDRLAEMLADYNRDHDIFSFVGHTHMPLYCYWSFHNYDGFPETYLPRLTDLSGEDNEIFERSGVAVEVEVYDNEVLIRGRNFYSGEWLRDEDGENGMCEVRYPLKNNYSAN